MYRTLLLFEYPNKFEYGQWRAKGRPNCFKKYAALHLQWDLEQQNRDIAQWYMNIFNGDCSIGIGKGKRQCQCFWLNHQGDKCKKESIAPYKQSKGVIIMVWDAIWGGCRSDVNLLRCDTGSERNGYSAKSYHEILEGNLHAIWESSLSLHMTLLLYIQPGRC